MRHAKRSIGCPPSLNAAALSLAGNLETVGIHGRHDVDPRRIDQPRDVLVFLVILEQELQLEAYEVVVRQNLIAITFLAVVSNCVPE